MVLDRNARRLQPLPILTLSVPALSMAVCLSRLRRRGRIPVPAGLHFVFAFRCTFMLGLRYHEHRDSGTHSYLRGAPRRKA